MGLVCHNEMMKTYIVSIKFQSLLFNFIVRIKRTTLSRKRQWLVWAGSVYINIERKKSSDKGQVSYSQH